MRDNELNIANLNFLISNISFEAFTIYNSKGILYNLLNK